MTTEEPVVTQMWPLIWHSLLSRDMTVLGEEQGLLSMFPIQTICMQGCLALLTNFFFWILSPTPLSREWASSCVVLMCLLGLNHISRSCAVGKSSWLFSVPLLSHARSGVQNQLNLFTATFLKDDWRLPWGRKRKMLKKLGSMQWGKPHLNFTRTKYLLCLSLVRGSRDQENDKDLWTGQRNGKQHKEVLNP